MYVLISHKDLALLELRYGQVCPPLESLNTTRLLDEDARHDDRDS
jgi:hypothetical protein